MLTALRSVGAVAAMVALAGVVAGCTEDADGEPEPEPGPADVDVPEGITLTSGGSTVDLGQPASVVYQPAGAGRTVITVRVDDITRGKPKELPGVAGVPFYVEASIHNAGPAALSGVRIPLYAVDGAGEHIDATGVTEETAGCDPLPLTGSIVRGATATGCLVFAVPEGSALAGVQVRSGDLSSPVTWKP